MKATSLNQPQADAENLKNDNNDEQEKPQKIDIEAVDTHFIRPLTDKAPSASVNAHILPAKGNLDEVRRLSATDGGTWWKKKEVVEQGLALITLLLQNTGMIILMRISRVKTKGPMYDIRTAVMVNEFFKLAMSLFFYLLKENGSMADIMQKSPPLHLLKVMAPSALYVVQNNLQYISLSHLPASVYQVLIQMKILTTAGVSEFLLGRKHNRQQWASLIALFVGLSIVQASLSASAVGATFVGNLTLGLLAVFVSCLTSATAGVYFEKVVKGTPSVGLWAFNTQMSACSLLISLASCVRLTGGGGAGAGAVAQGVAKGVSAHSLLSRAPSLSHVFVGFTPLVLSIVLLQAVGGLVVSLVVKKTNSVIKGFATSGAVVLSCFISRFLFDDFYVGPAFYVGAAIVTAAAAVFGQASPGLKKANHPAGGGVRAAAT